ncbi:hypothetical protein TI03_06675, partial [Achromatium sp. WMS1]
CAALLEQVVNSKDYRPQLKVFTIVVLTSGDRHKVDMAKINFDPQDRHGRFLKEIPHKLLYLCPKYVTAETPEPYREWLLAIQDSLDGTVDEKIYQKQEIQDIFDLIQKDQTTPQEYARMKDEYATELLINESKKEVAIKMYAKGFELTLIAELTELSLDELETILS